MKFEEVLKKEVIERVSSALPELYEARDKVAAQQEALAGRIMQLKNSRAPIEAAIEELRAQGAELAANGEDPLTVSKKLRAKEAEIEDIQGWLADLESRLAELNSQREQAETAIFNKINDVLASMTPEKQAELNRHLQAAHDLMYWWPRVIHEAMAELRGAYPLKDAYVDRSRTILIPDKKTRFRWGEHVLAQEAAEAGRLKDIQDAIKQQDAKAAAMAYK
jgi:chromosome segregation ATPase